jgi:hypothetical protein
VADLSKSIKDMPMFQGVEVDAYYCLKLCQLIYDTWAFASVPDRFIQVRGRSRHTQSEGRSDHQLALGVLHRPGYGAIGSRHSRQATTNQHSPAPTPDLQHDLETCSSPVDGKSARDAEKQGEQERVFEWDIRKWEAHNVTAVEKSAGWESDIFNDEQIGRYASSDIPYAEC